MSTNADPGDPLGYDAAVTIDLGPTGASCSGAVLVGNAMLHRLMEDNLPSIGAPGGFLPFGVKVRRWVGEVTTQARANAKAPELVMVFGRDDRLDRGSIAVEVTIAPPGTTMRSGKVGLLISVSARTTTQLPISRVYGVSAATVETLSAGP